MFETQVQVLESQIGNATIRTTGFTMKELDLAFFNFLPEGKTSEINYKLLADFVSYLNKNHCTSNQRSASITIF